MSEDAVHNPKKQPSNKNSLLRLLGALVGSVVLAAILSVALGVATYYLSYDSNDKSDWANFEQILLAYALALLSEITLSIVFYAKATKLLVPRLAGKRLTIVTVLAVIASCLLGALSLPLVNSAESYALVYPCLLLLTLIVTLAIVGKAMRLISWKQVQLSAGAYILLVVIGFAVARVSEGRKDQESVENWNGPVMLLDGNSGTYFNGPDAETYITRPYDNDEYSSLELQWRKYAPGTQDEDFDYETLSLEMKNTSVSDPCGPPFECEVVGQSKFGDVLSDGYNGTLIVEVSKGHLEVQGDLSITEQIAMINRLETVSAKQFHEATKNLD